MHINSSTCPHCYQPVRTCLPVEPFRDGRELREIIGWSKDRWNSHWTRVFPAYFQYKHVRGSVKSQLIRVFPASQIKPFMDSGAWLRLAQEKNRRTK